jgi:DNA polymerase sigma
MFISYRIQTKLMSRLIDFFRFFSHDFQFNNSVLSLRAGPLTKESKGWVNDVSTSPC